MMIWKDLVNKVIGVQLEGVFRRVETQRGTDEGGKQVLIFRKDAELEKRKHF